MTEIEHNLDKWVRRNTLSLIINCLIFFAILGLFNWANKSVKYANQKISVQGSCIGGLWEASRQEDKLSIKNPDSGRSWEFTSEQLKEYKDRYTLAIIAAIGTFLLFLGLFLFYNTLKSIPFLLLLTKQSFNHVKAQGLYNYLILLSLFFIAALSLFPVEAFAGWWWRTFPFLGAAPQEHSAIIKIIYGAMNTFLIHKEQYLFYALLFSLPLAIIKIAAAVSLSLLLIAYLPALPLLKKIKLNDKQYQIILILIAISALLIKFPSLKISNPYLLMKPILLILLVPVVFYTASEIYDMPTAVISSLLVISSGFFIQRLTLDSQYLIGGILVAPGCLFCAKTIKSPQTKNGIFCGLSFSLACLIFPQLIFLFILPALIYLALKISQKPKEYLLAAIPLYTPVILTLLLSLTGISVFPGTVPFSIHPPNEGFFHLSYRLGEINSGLLGAFIPALIIIALIPLNRRENHWDLLLSGGLLAVIVPYLLMYSDTQNSLLIFLPILFILCARGLVLLPEILENQGVNYDRAVFFLILIYLINMGNNLGTF